jgi:hypothetical protein
MVCEVAEPVEPLVALLWSEVLGVPVDWSDAGGFAEGFWLGVLGFC